MPYLYHEAAEMIIAFLSSLAVAYVHAQVAHAKKSRVQTTSAYLPRNSPLRLYVTDKSTWNTSCASGSLHRAEQ